MITLDPGSYFIVWSKLGGDGTFRVRLDSLDLIEIDTPIRPTTWGAVKATYREVSW